MYLRTATTILTLAAACTGEIGGATETGNTPDSPNMPMPMPMGGTGGSLPPDPILRPPPASCASRQAGPSPARRLTNREYNNTVKDLLGDMSQPAHVFEDGGLAVGFDNNAYLMLEITPNLGGSYRDAAERLALDVATNRLSTIVPCNPASGETACVRMFIQTFGKRAFRRSLAPAEIDGLVNVFTVGKTQGGSFTDGIKLVVEAILISPSFLYRLEFGTGPAEGGLVKLTSYEVATRLSYLTTGSTPDPTLLAAADGGQLGTSAQVLEQAKRLMALPAAQKLVVDFHNQWLKVEDVDSVEKADPDYAFFKANHRTFMRRETETFTQKTFFEGDGKLETLLTSASSYVNKTLAGYYGVTVGVPATDATFARVALDGDQRSGILTQATFLTAQSGDHPSTFRGKFVREQLLCSQMPSPNADLLAMTPLQKRTQTSRQWDQTIAETQACAGCHQVMNYTGFLFEHYDGVGRWRDMDTSSPDNVARPVDASGKIVGSEDIDGPLHGVKPLAQKLLASKQVESCVSKQWLRYMIGREETDKDACTLDRLTDQFRASGRDTRLFLLEYTQTPTFLYRSVP